MAQMLMNEYGSVQQHLEPGHVRDLLIPVPRNWLDAANLIASGKEFIESKEASDRAMQALRTRGFDRGMTELLG